MQLPRLIFILLLLTFTTFGSGAALRSLFPAAWQRWLRRTYVIAFVVGAVALVVWMVGRAQHAAPVVQVSAPVLAVVLTTAIALFVTTPVWGGLGAAIRVGTRQNPSRRAFLGRVLGVAPAAVALTGPAGALASGAAPLLREVELKSALIPKALDGLRILQISDVHLGAFVDTTQVRTVVDAAKAREPDLVALTGDIADDYDLLPPALAMVAELAPPLGTFAIIGNHEVYRGRDEAIQMFRASGARFLCDEGLVIEHNGARFWLGGTDDPAKLGGSHHFFYQASVDKALAACPGDVDCKVLLAHRPSDAFDFAAARGVAVTLSGHTHGAQMALFGRSLLEGLIPMKYLLGTYQKGESLLFTTAGLGHWFPFRLNCPAEAALITLRSA